MCILFLYVAKSDAIASSSSHPKAKLILASNRDELYSRPTKQAHFWPSVPNVLAGQDCLEGGTWLGISKTGRIAVLLNILSKNPETKLRTRGNLVTDFLRSDSALRGLTYCNNLDQAVDFDIRKDYGLFNFVTIDPNSTKSGTASERETLPETPSTFNKSSFEVTYFTNAAESRPRVLTQEGESRIFAFGNSTYDVPFCKVKNGRNAFETIVNKYQDAYLTAENKSSLKEDLVSFLNSGQRHFPDPQMEKQAMNAGHPSEAVAPLSSIFVTTDKKNYGTRTHSVIIIDSEDNVNFHEWTLQDPIDIDNPKWIESQYDFKLPQ